MKHYKEFTITAEPFNTDIISSLLWELEITGINEEVNCLKVFAEENSEVNIKLVSSQLQKLVEQKMLNNYNVEEYILEEKNWNEDWEKNLNVIEVSDKIVIKPTFREYKEKEGQIVITINPKMSFGTGEHQTTKLILLIIEKYITKDVNVLDIGSGTGILSIASIKFGAGSAVAIDNDDWCYDNAKENCVLNNVEEKVNVIKGEISCVENEKFELVLANIQKNILIDIADDIKERTKEEGIVILSGLLFSDENEILEKYNKLGLKKLKKMKMDEWISLVLKN